MHPATPTVPVKHTANQTPATLESLRHDLDTLIAAHDRLYRAAEAAINLAMQPRNMSFNLQYLQLQSQMQHENRSFTALSNIMKTKHDTVKNSISNVR
jgi:hypothetical protein